METLPISQSLKMVWNHLQGSPITKAYAIVSFVLSICSLAGLFDECDMFYSTKLIFCAGQYWRIISSLFYSGELSSKMVIRLTSFIQYSATLESNVFTGKPGERESSHSGYLD